jgi:hypothetical protein
MNDQCKAALNRLKTRRCVILICCSGSKAKGGEEWRTPSSKGLIDQMRAGDRPTIS